MNSEREFFLLSRIGGDDLPGGVRIFNSDADGLEPEAQQEALGGASGSDLGPLKFSLAGVQLKFSIRESDRGLTIPAKGESGDWIVKLPDPRIGFEGVPEAEYAGLELARRSGVATVEARLVNVGDIGQLPAWATIGAGTALAVRRFDRAPEGSRVHVEELAQVLDHPTGQQKFKYDLTNFETVARTALKLSGVDALCEVIDRIVLNVLVGNGDAHAKNWAFRYIDGRTATLSPAYDIVPTVLFVKHDDLGLNLAGSKDFTSVSLRSFERLALKAGWDPALGRERAAEAIERVVDAWGVLGDILPRGRFSALTEHRDTLRLVNADR